MESSLQYVCSDNSSKNKIDLNVRVCPSRHKNQSNAPDFHNKIPKTNPSSSQNHRTRAETWHRKNNSDRSNSPSKTELSQTRKMVKTSKDGGIVAFRQTQQINWKSMSGSIVREQVNRKDNEKKHSDMSMVEYLLKIGYNEEYKTIEVDIIVESLPLFFGEMPHTKGKNFPKKAGDYYLKFLSTEKNIEESAIKGLRDNLYSWPIWSCLLNSDDQYIGSKRDGETVLSHNDVLSREDWLSSFQDCFEKFDLTFFRENCKNIGDPNTRLLYEMKGRVMKEMAKITTLLKPYLQGRKIERFTLEKVDKEQGSFRFETNSADLDEQLVKEFNQRDQISTYTILKGSLAKASNRLKSYKTSKLLRASGVENSLHCESPINLKVQHKDSDNSP